MANREEQLEFDVGDNEEEKTVSMNEDGSEAEVEVEEQYKSPHVETESADEKKRQELDNYGAGVQKRIDKLTARLRESERRESSAIEYAKSVQGQNQELQERYKQTDNARWAETKGRIETQMAALKSVIRRAREEGDVDTETEASSRLTTLVMEQSRLSERASQAREEPSMRPQASAPQQAPQQVQRRPDPKAEEWAERNEWFGKDVVMSGAVRGIHIDLVQNQGFDPASDEYYDEIDRRMQGIFPEKFGVKSTQTTNRSPRHVQTVASATRSTGTQNVRRTVRLRPSQVAIAKKLGVPLEEYAKYVRE